MDRIIKKHYGFLKKTDRCFLLFAENDVESIALLQRMSNTRSRSITLDVDMEDYHRIVNGVNHKKRKNTAIDT